MNLNANPKQNFLDDQEKGTDLKIHLERTGVRSLILGCLCDGLVSGSVSLCSSQWRWGLFCDSQIAEVSRTSPAQDTVSHQIYFLPALLHHFPN